MARRFREAPAWVVSGAFHAIVIASLASITYMVQEEKQPIRIQTVLKRRPPRANFTTQLEKTEEGEVGTSMTNVSAKATSAKVTAQPQLQTVRLDKDRMSDLKLRERMGKHNLPEIGQLDREIKGKGDAAVNVGTMAAAVDRMTKELALLLSKHRLAVIWLFDESLSMRDEQRAVRMRFDRIYTELGLQRERKRHKRGDLLTVIGGYGKKVQWMTPQATDNLAEIKKAIDKLPVDKTGKENFCKAVQEAIHKWMRYRTADKRKLIICIVTDEAGDDDQKVENTLDTGRRYGVPIYVLGRQASFGYPWGHEPWTDPKTGLRFSIRVHRGPEAAEIECLQIDGIHGRWDQLASGFGPWGLTRLARETQGIYFILPTPGEKRYKPLDLRDYLPDYASRRQYLRKRGGSRFRTEVYKIIKDTEKLGVPHVFPGDKAKYLEKFPEARKRAKQNHKALKECQRRLLRIKRDRAHEKVRRWQAAYDLMLAQVTAYQVIQIEYIEYLRRFEKTPDKEDTKKFPQWKGPLRKHMEWHLWRKQNVRDPKNQAQRSEAVRLFDDVARMHPHTPWAARAVQEKGYGLSVQFGQYFRDPRRKGVKAPIF